MITLGGISLSENFYLEGWQSADPVVVEQKFSIDGYQFLRATPTPQGWHYTLGSQNRSGATQGIWCQSTIESIRALAATGQAVVLDYNGEIYNMLIAGMEFEPMFSWEPDGATKNFIGHLNLIEVN